MSSIDRLIAGIVGGVLLVMTLLTLVFFLWMRPRERLETLKPPSITAQMQQVVAADDPELNRLFDEARWGDAIALIEARGVPNHRPLGFALLSRVAEALREGEAPRDALPSLAADITRALGILTEDAVLSLEGARLLAALGVRALDENDPEAGRRWIAEARRLAGDDPYVCYVSGASSVREGNFTDALPLLEIGARAPEEAVAAASQQLIDQIKPDVMRERNFAVSRSERFVIRYDGAPRPEIAARFVSLLEGQGARVAAIVGRLPARPIEVILYTSDAYNTARGLPDWVGGIFDGRIRITIGDADLPATRQADILAHEYTHAAIREIVGRPLPSWFEEGLAQLVERGPVPDWTALRNQLAGASALELTRLDGPFVKMNGGDAGRAYAFSYAAAGVLVEKAGTGVFSLLLADLARGDALDDALRRTTGLSILELERATRARLE